MHRADHIIERPTLQNIFDGVLIFEVADLDARLDLVIGFQSSHERKIIVERVLKFIFLEPRRLKASDSRIIERQIIVVEPFELGECMRVFADADLVEPALSRRVEKSLHPTLIIVAVLEMHVIIEFHVITSATL